MTNEQNPGGLIQIRNGQIQKREDVCPSKKLDLADVRARIDAVTSQDLQKVAKAMLQTKLTLVAFGDVSHVPAYDKVQAMFK